METSDIKKPVLLLSYYLNDDFKILFEHYGFEVYHHDHFPLTPSAEAHVLKHFSDPESARAERMNWHDIAVRQYTSWFMNIPIDAVLEWQHGPDDFPLLKLYHGVRDLCKNMLKERYEEEIKTMPNFSRQPLFYLCLNWDGNAPENWREMGYRDVIPVIWEAKDYEKFYNRVMTDRSGKKKPLTRIEKIIRLAALKRHLAEREKALMDKDSEQDTATDDAIDGKRNPRKDKP